MAKPHPQSSGNLPPVVGVREWRRLQRGSYLEQMEIALVVVDVKYFSEQVPVAEVVFQVQYPLLEHKILVQPSEGLGAQERRPLLT